MTPDAKLRPCFGYFKPQNKACQDCTDAAVCRRVVARARLKPILEAVEKLEAVAKGEGT